ncbi:MAG: DUF3244 domain-containing protein [Mangrovibacterium sp.]
MVKKILIITLLISLIPAQYILAQSKPVIEGDWKEGEKSLYWSSRIEIDITGSLLTISSKTLRSDITIRISQSDETVFEQTVPASETECITIDLSNFEAGSYFLELTNQWGDYLYGYFYLE